MSRWRPDARVRLERAALELFAEQGFAETTVPQITARAGLTTRTFFRHFADKREVLFGVEGQINEPIARLVMDAPASLSPMQLVEYGLSAMAETFEGQHQYFVLRRAVIQSDASLRERELWKHAVLARTITTGLSRRGFSEMTATLIANLALSVLGVAMTRWLEHDGKRPLAQFIRDALDAVRALVEEPAHELVPDDACPPVHIDPAPVGSGNHLSRITQPHAPDSSPL